MAMLALAGVFCRVRARRGG